MNIRILLCLIVMAAVVACKKDDDNGTPKKIVLGTVLHIADRSPIANVEVRTPNSGVLVTDTTTFFTHTDTKGEFALKVPANSSLYYRIGLQFFKPNMVKCMLSGWMPEGIPDTTYMDEASYLRIIVKTNQSSGLDQWNLLGYFVYADTPPVSGLRTWLANDTVRYYTSYKGVIASDTVLIPYSHRLFKSGGAILSLGPSNYVVQKPVTLQAQATVETIIEY